MYYKPRLTSTVQRLRKHACTKPAQIKVQTVGFAYQAIDMYLVRLALVCGAPFAVTSPSAFLFPSLPTPPVSAGEPVLALDEWRCCC